METAGTAQPGASTAPSADDQRLSDFGYTPQFTTLEAFDDYVTGTELPRLVSPERAARVERTLLGLAARTGAIRGGVASA